MFKKRATNNDPELSNTPQYDFECVEAQPQARDPSWRTLDAFSRKQELESTLYSVSFWNKIFVIACVIAVSLDPLFFYIPVVNEKEKCLGIDKELRTAALILRALTDVPFIVHIIFHLCKATTVALRVHKREKSELESDWSFSEVSLAEIFPFAKLVAGKLKWRSTLTSVFAIFPIPQVLAALVFFKMRGHGYLEQRKILNVFLLSQYLPRLYQIHLSSYKLRQTTGIWVKALLNFFLYILASHVLGAFWYFFSIQRETSCWHQACLKSRPDANGCMSTFYCDSHNTTPRNTTVFEQFCPTDVKDDDAAPFDFGIFRNSLKKGITGKNHFATKLSYSFWWGLRNLSNFGTNLETSTYIWENCFAVLICIVGLLLFIYLIGNVQTFVSMETERREEIRNKILAKEKHIQGWMDKNELPKDMQKQIKKNLKQKLEEDKDVDLENLFSLLPKYTEKWLKRVICMKILKKVPKLETMDTKVLRMMCDYLKPAMYVEGTVVFQMGEPLHSMLLITDGSVLTYKTTSTDSHFTTGNEQTGISAFSSVGNLDKGGFYGEEMVIWASGKNVVLSELPLSAFNVKCHTKVEGFILSAKDLKTVVSKCENYWKLGIRESGGQNQTTANARHKQQRSGVQY